MCGIAGIISSDKPFAEERLKLMLEAIRHRGPDDSGFEHFASEEGLTVTLGHNRLSIVDISIAGHQPMFNMDRSLCIVFNGEIYNYVELKKQLLGTYVFSTHTDTEVLLACYEKYGVEMLSRLDGMFAFVLYDLRKKIIFAARDPIGIKPFYYTQEGGRFWFASEPIAILKGQQQLGIYNTVPLANFLLMGFSDYDNRTMLNNIQQLEGGHYFYESPANLLKKVKQLEYWSAPDIVERSLSESQSKYQEVLDLSVKRQLRSDVKLGTSLSGGIDSGAIVLTASKQVVGPKSDYTALTFTVPGFPDDESDFAQKVAAKAGFQWHPVVPDTGTLAKDLVHMMASMGEPFTTLSMFAQYKVMEKASQMGIKVMLDGQGGDEVNLGYPRVAQMVIWEHLKRGNIWQFFKEWKGFATNADTSMLKSLAYNIYFNSASISQTRRLSLVSRWVNRDFLEQYDKSIIDDLYEPCSVYKRQYKELKKYVLPRLLRYADRNSMAFSVESRVPHLAQPMIDFALSVPFRHRVNNGYTKFLERSALQGEMPDEVLWNPVKRGFDVPQAYWVTEILPLINGWIDNLPNDGVFKKNEIRYSLTTKAKENPYLWRVISALSLISISEYKIP